MTVCELVQARQLARTGDGRRLRERADLSLREVAAAIGVNPATLSRWETGKTRPSARLALRWRRAIEELRALNITA